MFFHHWLGNRFLTLTTNVLFNTTLSDMETCYKLFKREALEGIVIKSDRFNFEPEITAKILKKGIRIYEVPISYTGREFDEGKKNHLARRPGGPVVPGQVPASRTSICHVEALSRRAPGERGRGLPFFSGGPARPDALLPGPTESVVAGPGHGGVHPFLLL